MDVNVPAPLRCTEHLHGPNDPFSIFNTDLTAGTAFSPLPADVHQYYGPSNFCTEKPSSSKQPAWPAMPPSLPRSTKDIMDDTNTDEEHNGPPVDDFNMGGLGDENDTNDDDNITQVDKVSNMYVDLVMNFS